MAIAERRERDLRDCSYNDPRVRVSSDAALMRNASERNIFTDGKPAIGDVGLREVGEPPRALKTRKGR